MKTVFIADYKMNKKIISFYFIGYLGLEFFRTFSMATFSPYYIFSGLSYEKIALVKAIQLFTWFIVELPAGYLIKQLWSINALFLLVIFIIVVKQLKYNNTQ